MILTSRHGSRKVDPANPVGLLPILELGPSGVSDDAVRVLPIAQVLCLALRWGTTDDHWPRLAVDWLATRGVTDSVKEALADFASSRRGAQRTRHLARRLLRSMP